MSKIYVDEIRPKTSGNQVLMPEKPAFAARPSTGTIVFTSNGWHTITFGQVIFNIGDHYSGTNGYFTCPVDGVYQFNYHARFNSVGTGNIILCLADQTSGNPNNNNTDLFNSTYVIDGSPSSNQMSLATSCTIQLDANTTVQPFVYTGTDTSWSIQSTSQFSGFLVG